MPVITSVPISVFSQSDFHEVDEVVRGVAFAVHNEFGRYLDERLCQTGMGYRLKEKGLDVTREMQVTLTLDDFRKDYFVDFLLEGGVILETKTAEALTTAHRAQVLNYLFLCGLHHATLLNFRSERVQHEFVSTQLTPAGRRELSWTNPHFVILSPECGLFPEIVRRVLLEWGACLDPQLYRDAITHFLGGEHKVILEVAVRSDHGPLGRQKVHHLSDGIAFSVTSSVHRPDAVLEHQRRFLRHTDLRAIQWLNLNRQHVTLHTIQKSLA